MCPLFYLYPLYKYNRNVNSCWYSKSYFISVLWALLRAPNCQLGIVICAKRINDQFDLKSVNSKNAVNFYLKQFSLPVQFHLNPSHISGASGDKHDILFLFSGPSRKQHSRRKSAVNRTAFLNIFNLLPGEFLPYWWCSISGNPLQWNGKIFPTVKFCSTFLKEREKKRMALQLFFQSADFLCECFCSF